MCCKDSLPNAGGGRKLRNQLSHLENGCENGGGSGCGDGCWSSMIRNLAITHRWCISSSGKMLHKHARHSLQPLAWQCSTSWI